MDRSTLAFVLLAAAICVPASCLTSATSSPAEFVRDSCRGTRYPALCEQSLVAYAPAVHRSKRELARAALAVSADRARSASAFVSRMSSGGQKKVRSREAGAVRDCIETMHDSVDQLQQSMEEMGRMGRARSPRFAWHLSNVQTWVSAALTDETTCLDGISQYAGPAVRAAIRKKVVDVARVTSNALALVNQLGPRN
ncbi:pectinesterase inhibitor 9 [Musa acuminata AAA Group]|uniref:pectinesterase inhibitor 9 n=1 Tax=Musa acuminata AAA Group TaxID=214697 RepID=UPI0031E1DCB9